MVPKPGFTNQNPTIGSILGQNTSLMSDPTFFQDIGLQGIHTYIHTQLYTQFNGNMKAYIIWLQSFSMSPDICDASCIPERVQCSARDLSEALAWHLQSCRKARQLTQLAIAMTGSRFLEHPESHAKNVDVSQRKYSCKPSGKLRVRP